MSNHSYSSESGKVPKHSADKHAVRFLLRARIPETHYIRDGADRR